MSPFTWFKTIIDAQTKSGILHAPQFEGFRLVLFTSEKTADMPDQDLGPHAKSFMQSAAEQYAAGTWAPPLTQETVVQFYQVFDTLNQDLTTDEAWQPFWQDYAEHLETLGFATAEIQTFITASQQQILTAYRFRVISSTVFVAKQPNESQAEHTLKQIQSRAFCQNINRYQRGHTPSACFAALIQQFEATITEEVSSAIANFELQLKNSKRLNQNLPLLQKSLTMITSQPDYHFLGARGARLTKPITDLLHECHGVISLLDQTIRAICHEAVPGLDAEMIIAIEMTRVKQMPRYQHMSEHAARFAARYLNAPSTLKRIQDMILETRIKATLDFFADEAPFRAVQDQITRVTNPGWKRRFIERLFHEMTTDTKHFPPPHRWQRYFGVVTTPRRKQFQQMLQRHFLAILKREYFEINQALAMERLKNMLYSPVLQPIGKAHRQDSEDRTAHDELTHFINHPPYRASAEGKTLDLFDPMCPVEVDVAMGLMNQFEPILKYTQAVSQISAQDAERAQAQSAELAYLLENETIDEVGLSKAVRQIKDLEQRKRAMTQLYQQLLQRNHQQTDALVPLLQALYVNVIKEEIRVANPATAQARHVLYQTLLVPARALPLLQHGTPDQVQALQDRLDNIMDKLSS